MSISESFAGGPGVSAFFNGKELEADAQLEQEQITNEFHHAIASELQDLFKDFSETLSDEELLEESQNSSHVSHISDVFDKNNRKLLLNSPHLNSQNISESFPLQNHFSKGSTFDSFDRSEVAELDYGYNYQEELTECSDHLEKKEKALVNAGSFLVLSSYQLGKGNIFSGDVKKKSEEIQHLNSLGHREQNIPPFETDNKSDSRNNEVGRSNLSRESSDEWMTQFQTPHHPSIQTKKKYATGSSVDRHAFHNETFYQKSSSPVSIAQCTRMDESVHPSVQSQYLLPDANFSPPPPLPTSAPPSSDLKQIVFQQNEDLSQYKVQYNKANGLKEEEQFYIQTDQIEFFRKDFPKELHTSEQLTILYKARGREIEELSRNFEKKEEDLNKEIRSLKHKLVLATGDAEGTNESLKNCKQLLQQAQHENAESNGKIRALESQLSTLRDVKEEIIKKLQTSESTIANLTHHINELENSEILSRARMDHDNMITSLNQRHERELFAIKEKYDEAKSTLEIKQEEITCLKKQLSDLTQQLENNQISRAETINRLVKSLEDSQRQYQSLLQQSSIQELTNLKIQLQQSQTAKKLSDDLCQTFQCEIKDLKEQLNMFESASSLGVFTISHLPDNQDDSMTDLGIRKTLDFSTPKSSIRNEIAKMPDDLIISLKTELEKCIRINKQKRSEMAEKIEENKVLKGQLGEAQRKIADLEKICYDQKCLQERNPPNSECSSIIESRLKTHIENLKKEKILLLEDLEEYKKRLEEIGSSEAKLTEINQELSQQISQMVSDFDIDKRAALERCQRTLEEVHRMSVENLRSEIEARYQSEKSAALEHYTNEIKTLKKELESALSELDSVKSLYSKLCEEYRYQETELSMKFKTQFENELKKVQNDYDSLKNSTEERLKSEFKNLWEKQINEEQEKIEKILKVNFEKEMEARILRFKEEWDLTHSTTKKDEIEEVRSLTMRECCSEFQKEREQWTIDKRELENVLSIKEKEIQELKFKLSSLNSTVCTDGCNQEDKQAKDLEMLHPTCFDIMEMIQKTKNTTNVATENPVHSTYQKDENEDDCDKNVSLEKPSLVIDKGGNQTELLVTLKAWVKERIEECELKWALSKSENETGDENNLYKDYSSIGKTLDNLLMEKFSENLTCLSTESFTLDQNEETLSCEEMTNVIRKLKEQLKNLNCNLMSVKAKYNLELTELKIQHKKEFEKAAKIREKKFQNELKYFLKEREEQGKLKLEQVIKDYEMKSKQEIEKVINEMEINTQHRIQEMATKLAEQHRKEVKKAINECEKQLTEKLEKENNDNPGARTLQLDNQRMLNMENLVEEKELRERLERNLREEIHDEFSLIITKLEKDNLELMFKISKMEEEKCNELTMLTQRYEQMIKKLKEENEENILKQKCEYLKELEKLSKENNENKSDESNVKNNLINLLEREKEIEEAVKERVKEEIEKIKEQLEKQEEVRLHQHRTKWLQEARDYICNEIKQGVESKLDEERKKIIIAEAKKSEKNRQEEIDRQVKDLLELEKYNFSKTLEEINRQKEEHIDTIQNKMKEESVKLNKLLAEVEKNKEDEVNNKVKEKLVTEFENLKKKFVVELNARVLKEKSRLEDEVKVWRDEVKQKMEDDRMKFIVQMSEELNDKVTEERNKVKEEMKLVMESKLKELRDELEEVTRQRLKKEREEWDDEINGGERKQIPEYDEMKWKMRLKSETEARIKSCKERDTAVEFIKSVQVRHLEEKQRLKQCIYDLEQVKKEHSILEDKCKEMDQKYKADMKEARKIKEKEQARVREKEQIIVALNKQIKDMEEKYQLSLNKMKHQVEEERARLLVEIEKQANQAISQTLCMIPEFESTSYCELREHFLDTAEKMKAAFLSIIQSNLHSQTLKYESDLLEEFRFKCKACVRSSLTGLVQVSCILALEESIDELADNLVFTKLLPNINKTQSAIKKKAIDNEAFDRQLKNSSGKIKSVIKRVNEKSTSCKLSPKHISTAVCKEPTAQPAHIVNSNHSSQISQQIPHLEKMELDDKFYHTPTNSNNSSPAGGPRSQSHTQNSATKQHIELPDTPNISPKHLPGSYKMMTPAEAEYDFLSERSPRDAMKVMEARVRLANWASSGETPWKSSKDDRENVNVLSQYISLDEAQKIHEKEHCLVFNSQKRLEKDIDFDGFVRPGNEATNWVRSHKKSSLVKNEKLFNQVHLKTLKNHFSLDDSLDSLSSDGQASFHTLNQCNTTVDEDEETNVYRKLTEKGINPNVNCSAEKYKNNEVNVSNESISSSETEHFPLFQDHSRPSSTPLFKINSSHVDSVNKYSGSRTPEVKYLMKTAQTLQTNKQSANKSSNPLCNSTEEPFSSSSFDSFSEPRTNLQRYRSLEELLPKRSHDVDNFKFNSRGQQDPVIQKKANFKPYPVMAMTSTFWEKQGLESINEPNQQELGRIAKGYTRHTPLELRPFSAQERF